MRSFFSRGFAGLRSGGAGGAGGTVAAAACRRFIPRDGHRGGIDALGASSGPPSGGGSLALRPMPDLTRNAVDVLPEGRLAEQLAGGRPLRVKLGIDPTTADIHLGHTVVLEKLREFQERRPHGGPDHRRLHRPGRRSERALGTAAAALAGGDRGQRGDLPGAGLQDARPRADRGPLQQRVAADGAGGAARAAGADDGGAAARARRLPEAARAPSSRSRRWSCSTRCCRATTRSRSRPTSSSAGPTRSSTCSSAATSRPPTGSRRSRS